MDKIQKLEECHIDEAAIEITRATKTIQYLTRQVDELKGKLLTQKQLDATKVEQLKATILALNEGDVNDAIEVGRMRQELDQVRATNQQLSETIRSLQERNSTIIANPGLSGLQVSGARSTYQK